MNLSLGCLEWFGIERHTYVKIGVDFIKKLTRVRIKLYGFIVKRIHLPVAPQQKVLAGLQRWEIMHKLGDKLIMQLIQPACPIGLDFIFSYFE